LQPGNWESGVRATANQLTLRDWNCSCNTVFKMPEPVQQSEWSLASKRNGIVTGGFRSVSVKSDSNFRAVGINCSDEMDLASKLQHQTLLDKVAMCSERTSVFRGVQMTAAIKPFAHETQHRFLNGIRAKTAAEIEAGKEPQSIQAESSATLLLHISTQDPACTAASSSWHAHMRQCDHGRSRHATKHGWRRSDFFGIALRISDSERGP